MIKIKKSYWFLLVLLVIFLIGFFNYTEIKSLLFDDKVFLLVEKNPKENFEWSKYKDLFPENFDFKNAQVDLSELSKLNNQQKRIYDSILKNYYSGPKIIINTDENNIEYHIIVSKNVSVNLKKVGNIAKISKNEVKDLNIISIDSAIKLIPGLWYKQITNSEREIKSQEKIHFYLIRADTNNIFKIFQVEPIVIYWD